MILLNVWEGVRVV